MGKREQPARKAHGVAAPATTTTRWIPLAALGLLTGIPFWAFHSPGLWLNDWLLLFEIPRQASQLLDWTGRLTGGRPLLLPMVRFLGTLASIDVDLAYVALWLANLGAVWAIYAVASKVLRMKTIPATLTAAIWAVYPADATWSWLSMFGVRLATILACLAILSSSRALASGRRRWVALSVSFVWMTLLTYEATAVLLLVWPLAVLPRWRTWPKRLVLLATPLSFVPVVIWRAWAASSNPVGAPGASDRLGYVTTDPSILVERLTLGVKELVVVWLLPVQRVLGGSKPTAGAVLLMCVALGGAAAFVASRWRDRPRARSPREATSPLRLLLVGPFFAICGYFPVILLNSPEIGFYGSRYHEIAMFGAAITIVAGTGWLASWLGRERRNAVLVGFLLPLLLVGAGVQAAVRHDMRRAWRQQVRTWVTLIAEAPALEPGTTIVWDVSEVATPSTSPWNHFWPAKPIVNYLDGRIALGLFYGDRTLASASLGKNPYQELLANENLSTSVGAALGYEVPWDRLLIVKVRHDGTATVERPDPESPEGMVLARHGYAPRQRIARRAATRSDALRMRSVILDSAAGR